MSSSSSSASSAKGSSRRRIYITGYSSKEDPHDIKKLFKKYGKIEEFSWKGKFCFIVTFNKYFSNTRKLMMLSRLLKKCTKKNLMIIL